MKQARDILNCEEMSFLIEEYLDGELTLGQGLLVESHLRGCPACAEEMRLARQVQGALRSLPQLECPVSVSNLVLAQACAETRKPVHRLRFWLPLAAAAGLALLFTGWSEVHQSTQLPQYSTAEIQQAEDELRWTLALLTDINRRAGISIRDDVLEKRLVEPMKRATEHTL